MPELKSDNDDTAQRSSVVLRLVADYSVNFTEKQELVEHTAATTWWPTSFCSITNANTGQPADGSLHYHRVPAFANSVANYTARPVIRNRSPAKGNEQETQTMAAMRTVTESV